MVSKGIRGFTLKTNRVAPGGDSVPLRQIRITVRLPCGGMCTLNLRIHAL